MAQKRVTAYYVWLPFLLVICMGLSKLARYIIYTYTYVYIHIEIRIEISFGLSFQQLYIMFRDVIASSSVLKSKLTDFTK